VVSFCPECERETLVDQGRRGDSPLSIRWVCFSCGAEWDEQALWSCAFCGDWIPAGEGEMTVCSECFKERALSSD
jgi:hypothetical protein